MLLTQDQEMVRDAVRLIRYSFLERKAVSMVCLRLKAWMCRFLLVPLVLVGATAPLAWGAPEEFPAWPSERDLMVAMHRKLKDSTDKDERIWISGMHEVMIGKDETGFVVSVWFPGRGRNFSAGTFLYRPRLKQARQLDYDRSLGATYITGSFGRFVLLEQYGSGQGTEDFIHSLVRFEGWQAHVLHESRFGNNLGDCGTNAPSSRRCDQSWVKLQLLADDRPGNVDLIELTTRVIGATPLDGTVSVTSRRFRLKGDHFSVVEN